MVGIISHQNSELVLSLILIVVSISGFLSQISFNESFFGRITISLFTFSAHLSFIFSHLRVAIALLLSMRISEYSQFINFCSRIFRAIFSSENCWFDLRYGRRRDMISETSRSVMSGLKLFFLFPFFEKFIIGFLIVFLVPLSLIFLLVISFGSLI